MPLTLVKNDSIARLELPGGKASADVLLYGATVISWKVGSAEKLFLSKKTPLDGSAAIRGGIPLVFPVFGPASDHEDNEGLENVPRHGVARTAQWQLKQNKEVDGKNAQGQESATASFALSSQDLPGIDSKYQWPFELVYDVTLTAKNLTTSLHITHSSSSSASAPMRFQCLCHNYLAVPSSLSCSVKGLVGQCYLDKTDGAKGKMLSPEKDPIILNGQASDAVYLGPAPDLVELSYGSQGGGLQLTRSENCPQTVVWNPAEEGAAGMKDLHEGGWKEYICIEPGKANGFEELEKGQTFTFAQTLTAV
ncbi:galactose mutarotase-like protein [Microstroma glucosiphilum]|uniref:Glucose-6-phosphate 1-epimerase n=1 Tax=Pseudomicrostroma glucosiphilum TaxID=1684307 RepID=A0A316UHH8_9BASI|nr:galactose mutarotase-like protein [Pseudomicrostroma glucosiphilum]PWN23383.1 galactose mutarotase-like protein [Pseudomicrostroma glucosiphilum]